MSGDAGTVTSPIDAAKQWLADSTTITDMVGTRIGHQLGGTSPAIRLTDIGPADRGPAGVMRRIQVECWDTDYRVTEALAAAVENHLDAARGTWGQAYCAGGEVLSGPFANPDETSEKHRHQIDVGLWLYPVNA